MNRQDILNTVLTVIDDIAGVDTDNITESSNLITDVEVSSIEILSILGELEAIYDIKFSEQDMKDIATIGDLIDCIEK